MRKVLIYYANVDWFFISHRFDLAIKAQAEGFDVYILTPITDEKNLVLLGKNFNVIPLRNDRGFKLGFTLINLMRFVKCFINLQPDVIHAISIKPILITCLFSFFFRKPVFVFAFSGLGPVFSPQNRAQSLLKYVCSCVLSLQRYLKNIAIVQNTTDRAVVRNYFSEQKILLVRGSGVSCGAPYAFRDEGCVNISFAGRFVKEKGLPLFRDAVFILLTEHSDLLNQYNVKFNLAGWIDEDTRNPISVEFLEAFLMLERVQFFGRLDCLADFLSETDIFVFPSAYPEGVPKVLCEALLHSCAAICTRFMGSEDYLNDDNVFFVGNDAASLANGMIELIKNKKRRRLLSHNGYELASENFDLDMINDKQLRFITTAIRAEVDS